jgi:hypothetical protein
MTIPGSANPLLLASAAGGYAIERSVRFNSSDSAHLSRTPASAGNRRTFTWAAWVKLTKFGSDQVLFAGWDGSAANQFEIRFQSNNTFSLNTGGNSGSRTIATTAAVFRDPSAWYHLTCVVDTTQASASNHFKFYVNNALQTLTLAESGPQNLVTQINGTFLHHISVARALVRYFNGYLADVHFIDGQALDPTSFGEFDDNGIWQPIEYSGSFGTNGFHLPFSDNSTAAALGTDTSSNGNDWTVNNLIAGPATTSNSWSGYFDGNGDSLTTGASANLALGSGDFTVEAFIFITGGRAAIASSRVLSNQNLLYWSFIVETTGQLRFQSRTTGGTQYYARSAESAITTNKWYHVAAVRQSNVITVYVDGVAGPTTVNDGGNNLTEQYVAIGLFNFTSFETYFSGYISNFRIIKGTALYTSNFTPPNEPLTAITNTLLLTLQDSTFIDNSTNSFTLTANGNAKVSTDSPFEESSDTDSFVDVPQNGTETDTGLGNQVRGNYCTWNPLRQGSSTSLTNGNLDVGTGATAYGLATGTIGVRSGKYYWEITVNSASGGSIIGIVDEVYPTGNFIGQASSSVGYNANGYLMADGNTGVALAATYTTGDVIGVALDMDTSEVKFYKNNSLQHTRSSLAAKTWFPAISSGGGGNSTFTLNAGQRSWAYTAPSGFKALCTANLPAPVITKPSEYMDVKLYTGNGSTQTISGLEFSPDLVWLKKRGGDAALRAHQLFDVVRGANKALYSNLTNAEFTDTDALTSFDSDGFSLGAEAGINTLNDSLVAWTWDAGSSTVTNTDGSITSNCRTNASAGFSIVSWVSTGVSETIGHGLGVAPKIHFMKNRSSVTEWPFYTTAIDGSFDYLFLNLTNGKGDSGLAAPTSTVFTVNNLDPSGSNMIAYCFAPVEGYSAFGSYTGNGSADGPFVYTGFRPRWVMIKNTGNGYDGGSLAFSHSWVIVDAARYGYNVVMPFLGTNKADAEYTANIRLDLLSNGFKIRTNTGTDINGGETMIYAAFAESPMALNNRAR